MERIRFDNNLINFISLFETITRVKAKDLIADNDQLIFLVPEKQVYRAIGRQGSNVKTLSNKLNKKIRIVGFSEKIEDFVRNFTYPAKINEIEIDGETLKIKADDRKTKALLIGRDSTKLNLLKRVLQRYHKISSIRVI